MTLSLLGNLDTHLHPDTFAALVPALLLAGLVVRPAWGALPAGAGAGGMIGLTGDSVIVDSGGVPWSPAIVLALTGMGTVAILLALQAIRLWPHAHREARTAAGHAVAPGPVWRDASPGPDRAATAAET